MKSLGEDELCRACDKVTATERGGKERHISWQLPFSVAWAERALVPSTRSTDPQVPINFVLPPLRSSQALRLRTAREGVMVAVSPDISHERLRASRLQPCPRWSHAARRMTLLKTIKAWVILLMDSSETVDCSEACHSAFLGLNPIYLLVDDLWSYISHLNKKIYFLETITFTKKNENQLRYTSLN